MNALILLIGGFAFAFVIYIAINYFIFGGILFGTWQLRVKDDNPELIHKQHASACEWSIKIPKVKNPGKPLTRKLGKAGHLIATAGDGEYVVLMDISDIKSQFSITYMEVEDLYKFVQKLKKNITLQRFK